MSETTDGVVDEQQMEEASGYESPPPILSPNYYDALSDSLYSQPSKIPKINIASNNILLSSVTNFGACASKPVSLTNPLDIHIAGSVTKRTIQNSQHYMQSNSNSSNMSSTVAATSSQEKSVQNRHIRKYAQYNKGPYSVFMHELDTPITPLAFSTYIHLKYKSVELIKRSRGKLKIILKCWKEANALVVDQHFKHFHVTIPADLVEVVGAIDMQDICDMENAATIVSQGKGGFNNTSLARCNIIQAEQLFYRNQQSPDGEKSPSSTMKITFEGQILPDYILIDCLRIRVRPFYNKPMYCNTCQQFGHTIKYCKQKVKCARCHASHDTSTCNAEDIDKTICPFCLCPGEHDRANCAYFKEATEIFKIKQQQRLRTKRQQADASTREAAATSHVPELSNAAEFPVLQNRFVGLDVDDPQPSTSANSRPPRLPYSSAIKSTVNPSRESRTAVKRPRSIFTQIHKSSIPSSAEPSVLPSMNNSRRRSVSRVSRGASNNRNNLSANPLISLFKAAIMVWVNKSNISQTWLSIIETIIDPLLEALLPALTSILASNDSHCPPRSQPSA